MIQTKIQLVLVGFRDEMDKSTSQLSWKSDTLPQLLHLTDKK